MAFCTNCGHDFGVAKFCTNCGQAQETVTKAASKTPTESASAKAEAAATPPAETLATITSPKATFASAVNADTTNQSTTPAGSQRRLWVLIGSGIAALVIVLVIGAVTAKHWVKTDIPAHAETFHAETFLTGNYDIVDDHWNPCWIGQDWTDCTNTFVYEYNRTCAAFPLSAAGGAYCNEYSAMIDDMKARDSYGSYVSGLGTWGSLTAVPESATQQVSNNDYRPAVTHKAVCVFGFLGECK